MYEQIINFISSLIPTRLEVYIGGGVAFVGVLSRATWTSGTLR